MKEQEVQFRKRLADLARTAYYREIPMFTDFLDLNELHMVHSFRPEEAGVMIRTFGGYEEAERQIAAFLPDALSYDYGEKECFLSMYPIRCIRISPCSGKFSETLTHRDYLGALIHLGMERSMLGDILVKKDGAYVFCQEHMAAFIIENLCRIRHTNVLAKLVTQPEEFPNPEFQTITGSVASLRLDSVIALAFHASRSSLVQNIENGNVFVNGKMITSNGYSLKEGDIISLRGKGKFQLMESGGKSKKGRLFIKINRYV